MNGSRRRKRRPARDWSDAWLSPLRGGESSAKVQIATRSLSDDTRRAGRRLLHCEICDPAYVRFGSKAAEMIGIVRRPCPLCPQKRTWIGATGHVRLVPKADSCTAAKCVEPISKLPTAVDPV